MATSNSTTSTKMLVLQAVVVVVMLLTVMMATGVRADDTTYKYVVGKQFSIKNVFAYNGDTPCPTITESTVQFVPTGNGLTGQVVVVGNFAAGNIGVCVNANYGYPPGTTINYYVYGDWIIFQISGYVSSAAKILIQQNQIVTVAVGNNFYVSILTRI